MSMLVARSDDRPADDAAHSASRPPRRRRFADALALAPVVLGFVVGMRPLDDPDIWWHLRLGIGYLHGVWPTQDTWGYLATADQPYVLHQWLGQLLFGTGYTVAGYDGVIVVRAALVAAVLAAVLHACRRRAGEPLAVAIVMAVTFVGLYDFTNPRPQLISFALLAALGPLWLDAARQSVRPPLWTVPLMTVWANTHGLWVTAIALYALLVAVVAVTRGWRRRNEWLPLVLMLLAYLAAALVNPWGWRLFVEPLVVARAASGSIGEWQPPHMLDVPAVLAVALLAIVVIGWARRTTSVSSVDIAYVLTCAVFAMATVRTVAVALVLLAPLAARELSIVAVGRRPPLGALARGPLVAATAVALAIGGGALAVTPSLPADTPYAAARQLQAVSPTAQVLCDYDLCGWLLWDAPSLRPAIDTRTEIYDPRYTSDYLAAIDLEPGWEALVAKTGADVAWLRSSRPLVQGLRDVLGWREVWHDDWSVILVPPSPTSDAAASDTMTP